MSVLEQRHSPRYYKAVVLGTVALICAVVGLTAFVIGQSQKQHQICQLIGFFGKQTQHGIDTNLKLVHKDTRIGTKDALADAEIRRGSLKQAYTFLQQIDKAKC